MSARPNVLGMISRLGLPRSRILCCNRDGNVDYVLLLYRIITILYYSWVVTSLVCMRYDTLGIGYSLAFYASDGVRSFFVCVCVCVCVQNLTDIPSVALL
jgi:hypothetical protein